MCVQSACLKFQKPLVLGGTFSAALNVDYFPPNGSPCLLCYDDDAHKDVVDKVTPGHITEFNDLSFIKKDRNPISQSNYYLCSMCANLMVAIWVNKLMNNEECKNTYRYSPHPTKTIQSFLDSEFFFTRPPSKQSSSTQSSKRSANSAPLCDRLQPQNQQKINKMKT